MGITGVVIGSVWGRGVVVSVAVAVVGGHGCCLVLVSFFAGGECWFFFLCLARCWFVLVF